MSYNLFIRKNILKRFNNLLLNYMEVNNTLSNLLIKYKEAPENY